MRGAADDQHPVFQWGLFAAHSGLPCVLPLLLLLLLLLANMQVALSLR
jgi:hypothetical protein